MDKIAVPLSVHKVLVVNLGGIGDILLSQTALHCLRELYPRAEIVLLISPRCKELVRRFTFIDSFFMINLNPGVRSIVSALRVLKDLYRMKFDLAINMRTIASFWGACKLKLLLWVISARKTAGRNTQGRGGFFDVAIEESDDGKKSERDYDIETVKMLEERALPAQETSVLPYSMGIELNIREKDYLIADEFLGRHGVRGRHILIGIHPGGALSRRWPLENFAQAVRLVAREFTFTVVITGSHREAALGEALMSMIDGRVCMAAGKFDVYQSAALIKRCAVYLSNDTGPMHIAAALHIPLVAIFGAGDLVRFDPRNISEKAVVLHKHIACAPCNKQFCPSLQCLKSIHPGEAAAAITLLLRTGKHASAQRVDNGERAQCPRG